MTIQSIPVKLIERKGKRVELEIEGQKLDLPSEYLPDSIQAGEIAQLCFLTAKDAKIKEDNLAKLILEEILNGK